MNEVFAHLLKHDVGTLFFYTFQLKRRALFGVIKKKVVRKVENGHFRMEQRVK